MAFLDEADDIMELGSYRGESVMTSSMTTATSAAMTIATNAQHVFTDFYSTSPGLRQFKGCVPAVAVQPPNVAGCQNGASVDMR